MNLHFETRKGLPDAISGAGERLSAVELTHTKLRASWRHRVRQALERGRVTRFLKDRAASIAQALRSRGQEGRSYA